MIVTLGMGLIIGAIIFGGSSNAEIAHDDHQHELNENGEWTCSMHPQVRQSEPGSCPFCGMDLIPVESGDDADPTVLKMSNEAVQLANIQTTIIGTSKVNNGLILNGKIKVDDRRVNTQTTHFPGRIEELYKNFEGEQVNKGDRIASVFSPELLAAQEELIEAKKLERTNPVLLDAARKKLKYWKLSDHQIREIENSREAKRNFDLHADFDGVITKKMVNNGDHLHEGDALFEITDLSRLWMILEVYEKDLGKVKLGDEVKFVGSGNGGTLYMDAPISFISPEVNPQTRIVEARAEFNNNGHWKPDMLVKGIISSSSNDQELVVPKSAVLWTGKRSIVYVKTDDLSFQLREVELGPESDDNYIIREGLSEGDEVVTNGAFTIDAEAQLQGKNSMMNQVITVDHPENSRFEEVELPEFKDFQNQVDPKFQKQLEDLSMEYIALKDLMVEGKGTPIRKAGIKVKEALSKVDMNLAKGEAHLHWMTLLNPMTESLRIITSTGDRDLQRLQFINLSKALINAIQSFGTSFDSPLYVQFCPMANNDKGATWVSLEEEIINPYFGDAMLHCGNVEAILNN